MFSHNGGGADEIVFGVPQVGGEGGRCRPQPHEDRQLLLEHAEVTDHDRGQQRRWLIHAAHPITRKGAHPAVARARRMVARIVPAGETIPSKLSTSPMR